MNIFLSLIRLIFKKRLTGKEKRDIIRRLKAKKKLYKIKNDGL